MKPVVLCILLLVICASAEFAQVPGYTEFRKSGKYSIKLRGSDSKPVVCNITIVNYSIQTFRKGWWGVMSDIPNSAPDTPRTIIEAITFVVGGKEFAAPLSSYADLAEPNRAMVQESAGHYRLLMDGSDAAAGYRVKIDFDGWHVIERTVQLAEFPENYWEKSVYHVDTTGID